MKVAVVTGGSRGIGKAIVKGLAADGYTVVINYAGNEQKALEVLEEINGNGFVFKADVSKMDECEALVNKTLEAYGQIDVLVNNAGITRDGLLLRMSEQDFDDVIFTNLKGTFNMSKLVSKAMMKKRCGRIINMSSVVGLTGNVGQANYAASKGGVISFSKSLAQELASRNILVNAIAPGFIETDMTGVLDDNTKEKILAQIPLNRMGSADDVANLVCFLASEKANYITGQVIQVDGGMVL